MQFRRILRAVCTGAFLVCIAAPLAAAQGWTQVRSKNFDLIGDAPEREIRQSAARLEQFRETFRVLFPEIKLDGGVPTKVVVFRDAASYAPFKPKRSDGSVDNAVKGYFLAAENVNYITLAAGERPGTYGTVFHEYVHYLLDINIGRSDLPPWLGEGLAEYFETLQVQDAERVTLGAPPPGHLALLRKNGLMPLSSFFAVDNSSLHRTGDESRSLFYAQAWALTHYLLQAPGPEGRGLSALITSIKASDAAGKPLGGLLTADHQTLAKMLREYIDRPATPARVVNLPQRIGNVSAMTAAPMSPAGTSAFLGDLLYHTGELAEAEKQLRNALRIDPELASANASLGLLLVRKRSFGEARKHLERSIAAEPRDHIAYFNYAYALCREYTDEGGTIYEFPFPAAEKMRAALLRSIELNPGFAESYRLLAFVNLVNHTDLAEAARLLNKASALRPGDQNIKLLLAKVLLRQENYDDAGDIARKLAATAAGPDIWSEANGIMRVVEQYEMVKAAGPPDPEIAKAFGPVPPLILKRSALTDSDVARYEEERQINNLNVYVDRPKFGEKQVVGYVDKITCTDDGIRYGVSSGGETFELVSTGFAGIHLRVLTEGERSITLDCGVSLGKQLTVLTFKSSLGLDPQIRGRLLSMNFVPDFFRLRSVEEMANRRMVIIEDDRIFTNRGRRTLQSTNPEK